MPDNDPLKTTKDGVALLGEVMKTAGDNPHVKEAGNNLGQTAVTLTNLVNNILLPIAMINFACEKARRYFQGKFQQDLGERDSSTSASGEQSIGQGTNSIDPISWPLIFRALLFKAYGVKVGHSAEAEAATPAVKIEITLERISWPVMLRMLLFLITFAVAIGILLSVFAIFMRVFFWLLISLEGMLSVL